LIKHTVRITSYVIDIAAHDPLSNSTSAREIIVVILNIDVGCIVLILVHHDASLVELFNFFFFLLVTVTAFFLLASWFLLASSTFSFA